MFPQNCDTSFDSFLKKKKNCDTSINHQPKNRTTKKDECGPDSVYPINNGGGIYFSFHFVRKINKGQ